MPIALPEEPAPLEAPLVAPVPPFAPDATEPVVDPVPLASPLLIPELVTPELAPVDPLAAPRSPDMAPVDPPPVNPEPPPTPVVPAPLPAPAEAPVLDPLGRGLSLLQAAAKRKVEQQIAQTKARGFILFQRGKADPSCSLPEYHLRQEDFSGPHPLRTGAASAVIMDWEVSPSQGVRTIPPP
jgi:hypothetical protein